MKTEDILIKLNHTRNKYENDKVMEYLTNISGLCNDVIPKIEQLLLYENIGLTPDEIEKLKSKSIPAGVIEDRVNGELFYYYHYYCPTCNKEITGVQDYCIHCGQRLLWD